MLSILGLGSGAPEDLSLGALQCLKQSKNVILRTAVHPIVPFLAKEEVSFISCDDIYEEKSDFEAVYQAITERVFAATASEDVVYAVPGHPMFGETTVKAVIAACESRGIPYRVIPGISFVDRVAAALKIDVVDGLSIIDAYTIKSNLPDPRKACFITQIHNRHIASEVKLALGKLYSDDLIVIYVIGAGTEDEQIIRLPLYEIDRVDAVNHLTTLYIPADPENKRIFSALTDVMSTLLGPRGCPWDKAQTSKSLRRYLLEETYEAIDAIDRGDAQNLAEELGDILFEVVFQSALAEKEDQFDIGDVLAGITSKMISRHPHVFGDLKADTPDAVSEAWDIIKQKEKHTQSVNEEMHAIPKSFTALMTADKLQSKAGRVGFDWDDPKPALEKVREETDEADQALASGDQAAIADELGDVLFATVNVIRLCGLSPELVLKAGNEKFLRRFDLMAETVTKEGKTLENLSLDEMEAIWEKVKHRADFV